MTSPGGTAPVRAATGTERPRFRPELQGLRALAAVLVVVYHVWVGRVSGGVDVFFVITGFLITGGLYRAAGRDRIRLRSTWTRQLSRLLPAITVVLAASVVAGALVLPESRWLQTVRETVASLLFLENWQLAHDAVDYAARGNSESIVQHFWSLAIQGQFYLVWPLLVGAVALVARQRGADLHRLLSGTLAVVGGVSLAYSVYLTIVDQPLAYFHSLTRVWEFALGGLLALWISRLETRPVLTPGVRASLGWVGVVLLVTCGAVLTVERAFPGYAALWPTMAAVLVLLAGRSGHRLGADRLLSGPVLRSLGDVSFPLYLWHWPILTLTLVYTGRDHLGPYSGGAVIALSLVLAYATHRLVERPLQQAGTRRALRISLVFALVVLLGCAGWAGLALVRSSTQVEAGTATHPGATVLDPSAGVTDVPEAELTPTLVKASDDWSYRRGVWQCAPSAAPERQDVEVCHIPAPGPGPAAKRVAVVGDSHAQQFVATMMPVAAQKNWEIIGMFRGACPFSTTSDTDPNDAGCVDWNAKAADELAAERPDAVIGMATRDVRPGGREQTPAGFVGAWWKMHDAGIPVIAVRDNPRPDFNVPDCVGREGRNAESCAIPRSAAYENPAPYTMIPDVPPNVSFLDMADGICTATTCPSEVGNVLVYMDDNHLTASYAETLAPRLARHTETALGWH
ncbi:acyltransferase family protein [Pseudonocardia phyllosphaerae]|uniref:acyltransferase family protein n=1 Tax=Pseudonocardia phyllosphaerae TaxID=3390502 RepID=UPI003979D7F6